MSIAVNQELLSKLAPRVSGAKARRQAEIIRGIAAEGCGEMVEYAHIDTPLRLAHFLAQTAHESDGFCTLEEYASGAAYEGRRDLGNTQKGDGCRYKGRGLIQVTGRANYAKLSADLAQGGWISSPIGYVERPELLANHYTSALRSAFWYWQARGLNAFADKDDLAAITRRINGGLNGLESRRAYLARAKRLLGLAGGGKQPAPMTIDNMNAGLKA